MESPPKFHLTVFVGTAVTNETTNHETATFPLIVFLAHLTLYSRILVTANAAVAVRNPGNAKVTMNPKPATRGSALRRREGFTRTIAHGSTSSWRMPESSLWAQGRKSVQNKQRNRVEDRCAPILEIYLVDVVIVQYV